MPDTSQLHLPESPDAVVQPRVGIFTTRMQKHEVFRTCGYELEDSIALFEDSVFVSAENKVIQHPVFRMRRWLENRQLPGRSLSLGLVRPTLEQDFDLFFTAPALPRDLVELTSFRDWRRRSKVAICYLQELWVSEFDMQLPSIINILNEFDYVFIGLHHSAEPLADRLDVPVEYMPLSVDGEAWAPCGPRPLKDRVIDLCAIGTMDTLSHDTLYDWAEETGRFYSYTTTGVANYAVSHHMHRQYLADTLQRSKFFFTYMAKRGFNQRAAQEEFGPRYFEGAAAGAILLGDAVTNNAAYRANIDWEDAVFEVPFSSADLPEIIEAL
ncbi:MAG: hypothetical protein AAFY04_03765, partial [Pseudomonadota bacterium]